MGYSLIGSIEQSLVALWIGVMQFLPQLIVAIVVLVVGWIIGGILSGFIRKVFRTLKIDEALDKAGVDDLSKKAGYVFKPGQFVGALVKWFVILAFAVVAFDVLKLQEVTTFMREVVLGYLPQVFVAVLILFAAMLIANIAEKSLSAALRASGTSNPELFGKIGRYLVIGFGIMAAMNQLQIADELIGTLFTGIVFALSLALGLAFGLGGKDAAGRYVDRVTRK